MKYIGNDLIMKIEGFTKDQNDLEKLISQVSVSIQNFRREHALVSGTAEAAIGITAIAAGSSAMGPMFYTDQVAELIGSLLGGAAGSGLGGAAASVIGGIGVAMMGTAFAIPAAAIIAIGALAGGIAGSIAGWFGAELSSLSTSIAITSFSNFSAMALVAFGCYMLFLGLKDLWRGGGELIEYLKNLKIDQLSWEEQS